MPDSSPDRPIAPAAIRREMAPVLEARRRVAAAHEKGVSGRDVLRLMSAEVENIVVSRFERAFAQAPVEGAALFALGGFGRRELAPFSDVDLLLLVPEDAGKSAAALAEAFFTPLWDAGLEPGTALRTSSETLASARADATITTTLLDARFLAGDRAAARAVIDAFWEELRGQRLELFIRAKIEELESRRARYGGSVYLLEPNIKTGVGGLRDLAGALWVTRARHHKPGISGVAHFGLLPRREVESLRAARDRLFRLRTQLHLQAGRRDDRLTFAAQEAAARALGYEDTPETLGVELLMRDFYLAAQVVEQATGALIDRCSREAREPVARRRARPLDEHLEVWVGRVTLRDHGDLRTRPELLVELFATAERERLPVLGTARDAVVQEVQYLGQNLASHRRVHHAFLDYLQAPGSTGEALRGMYEAGVLGGLFPELARLRARVQHDLYHVYTVDTHTLFALQKLLRLRAGLLSGEAPSFTRLAQAIARPLPLYIGLFFHDLGKGMGGNHSVKGEALVRGYAERVGLDEKTTEDAAFLVREHLRLSHVAFRRDLADPALVADVVSLMGSRERLDMLYLLTYADISSVGPETWNDWRSSLLAELYGKCRRVFEETDGDVSPGAFDRTAAAEAGARTLRHALRNVPDVDAFVSVLPERYLVTISPRQARNHLEVWARARQRPVAGALFTLSQSREAGEVVVVAQDRPGMLAQVAGSLAAHSMDILSAQLFSLEDGRALDAFLVRGPGGGPPRAERVSAALGDLERVLAGVETVQSLLSRRRGSSLPTDPRPAVTTKILFDLGAARDATVVDVYTEDRVGLLHEIASALHRAGASIILARAATEGHRAADGFYLQDLEGRKITDPARLREIERALREALGDGSEAPAPNKGDEFL